MGSPFEIDDKLGIIRTAGHLDRSSMVEYWLGVKAADNGSPQLTTSINVNIRVQLADKAPPR